MQKLDLKKQFKQLYQPRAGVITAVEVPPFRYLTIDGHGDPNTSTEYAQAIEALYALAYTLKFSLKKAPKPVDYGVMPLEGLWWADDYRVFHGTDKSQWKWTAMILQPDFIAEAQIDAAIAEVRRKKNPVALDKVRFVTLEEGPCAQVLYTGPYADEGPTIQRVHEFIHTAGKQLHGKHHEIYLSDPRRTAPEKLKTIIRQPMR
ncbi:MAG: GyrI-like domain-containing protein [Terracidiphilus sp.]|nr:GyrI-like domain-containing protein [Terracidiphilus sp.]